MVFYFIKPERIRDAWPDIRASVERVITKTGEPWLPEDVYHALMKLEAFLHVGYEADEPRFVFVLVPGEDYGQKVLKIWLASSLGGSLDEAIAWIRAHAAENGFHKITFASPRKGWAKYFKPAQVIYEV